MQPHRYREPCRGEKARERRGILRRGGGFPAGLRDQRAAERQILPDVHGDIPQLPAALCGDLRGGAGIFRRKRRRAAAPPGADEKDVLPRRGGHGCFCRAVRAENELRSVYAVLPCRGKAVPLPKDGRIGAFVQRRRAFGPAVRRERAKPRAVQERAAAALLSLSQQREIIDKRPAGCRVLQQIPAAEDERAGALHSSADRRNVQIIQTVGIKPARRFLWPVREHRDRAFRRGGAPIAQKIFEHQLIAAVAASVGSGDHELPPGRENSAADLFFAQRHGGEGKLLCRPVTERCAELFAQRRIARERQNIRCKRGGIAGGDEKAVNAVFHKLRHAADGGRNDRHAVFCRVGERIGKRLGK